MGTLSPCFWYGESIPSAIDLFWPFLITLTLWVHGILEAKMPFLVVKGMWFDLKTWGWSERKPTFPEAVRRVIYFIFIIYFHEHFQADSRSRPLFNYCAYRIYLGRNRRNIIFWLWFERHIMMMIISIPIAIPLSQLWRPFLTHFSEMVEMVWVFKKTSHIQKEEAVRNFLTALLFVCGMSSWILILYGCSVQKSSHESEPCVSIIREMIIWWE